MISNQQLTARLAAGLTALALIFISGCHVLAHHKTEEAPPAPQAASAAAPPEEEQTATEAATVSDSGETSSQAETAPGSDIVNPTAPKSYVVKSGDTLWDIAKLFLRDPWLWPEVWYNNPKVQNPHLIYPGDELTLAYGADGKPQIMVSRGGAARLNPRLRSTPLDGAIPTLPYSAIAGFLSRPAVLSKDDIRGAPHVLAMRDRHIVGGAGNEIYIRGLKDAVPNSRYNVLHIGDPIRDPQNGHFLGYEGIYTATAVIMKPGDTTKAQLIDSERETLEGDKLFAMDNQVPLNFALTNPSQPVQGQIASVINGVQLIGQYQIVTINRGSRDGLIPGNLLAVDQAGEVVRDREGGGIGRLHVGSSFGTRVRLPDERAGTLLVFKTYDRASFGLIIGAASPMKVADIVHTP